ncbi:MAG TPA: type I DNA topoisomerase [Actinomycetota bacterium]|nr:type I DNA topoisomerase [Actinomycetota bacterium]
MSKNGKSLVVVESPTKAKTLERYLGPAFSVKASYGHVRDLRKNRMAVDTERNFEPDYVVPEKARKVVAQLKAAHKRSGDLYLATDFDREGEAIAWHVAELLDVAADDAKRVTFTEITEDAVREAFDHPRRIDLRLVEAQQARRIIDRLVGYNISPILWKKVRPGLSAGRVQSVALRLVVEREREISAFRPQEYWTVDARLTPDEREDAFLARLVQVGDDKLAPTPGKKGSILAEGDAREHAGALERASYRVADVRRRETKRRPAAPFTTSTLQQEAARKLGFSAKRTMAVAQQLYEGVDLPGEGQVGLITYMRTDSTNVAAPALKELQQVVKEQYGDRYALEKPRRYRTKTRGAQEAHEAVRPTRAARLPDDLARHLGRDQARLYRLIWQRTVASQMAEAVLDQVSVDVEATAEGAPRLLLRATGQTLRFDGFRRVYFEGRDDAADEDADKRLPELRDEQGLRLLEVLPERHETQPPPRYTEASLVKTLEELGIGRPSTYAPTISTLLEREYVRLEERRFYPTDVGEVVTDLLVEHFPDVVDYSFTARMEDELDDIAEGKMRWVQVLDEFYGPFERLLEKKEGEIERPQEELDELCPLCPEEGREPGNLVVKLGRAGKFVGCSNWPECKYTRDLSGQVRPEPELLEETCPECGRQLVRRFGRYGPFVGCSGYPDCRYIKKEEKRTGVTCPKCGQGELVEKRARRRGRSVFYGCNRYPDCDFTVGQKPVADPCPRCQGLMVAVADGVRCTNCGYQAESGGGPTEAA